MTNDQFRQQDEDQLRSIAIAFRVVGGLCALCINIAWIYIFFGILAMFTPAVQTNSHTRPPDAAFGAMFGGVFVLVGVFALIAGYTLGFFGFRAAKCIEARQNWNLCFGTSIAFILFQPLGTVLGILALIVLNRPSVRELFRNASESTNPVNG